MKKHCDKILFLGIFICTLTLSSQNTYTYQIIDAANNIVALPSFSGDVTWGLDVASSINVVSNAAPNIYSKVVFQTVENSRTESVHPYAYYGDVGGDYGLQNGNYYGWSPTLGTLDFTVRYYTGGVLSGTDTFTITFVSEAPVPVNSVAMDKVSLALNIGGTGQLIARISPANATDQTVGWSSDKTSIATVNSNGLVRAVAVGTAIITAKTNDGNKTATSTVSVTDSSTPPTTGGHWAKADGSQDINYTAGNVGIGTSSPVTKLDVNGSLRAIETITVNTEGSYKVAMNGQSDGYIAGRDNSFVQQFLIKSKGNSFFNGGNVGIGTSSPDEALTVKGTIHTQEVRVDLNGVLDAPDYVFYKDYKLRTLQEIQEHIDQFGHLPNIPSAKEMETNGVNLKEMNLKLLEKIEELTLYILEQDQTQKQQDKKQQMLEQRIEQLESQN